MDNKEFKKTDDLDPNLLNRVNVENPQIGSDFNDFGQPMNNSKSKGREIADQTIDEAKDQIKDKIKEKTVDKATASAKKAIGRTTDAAKQAAKKAAKATANFLKNVVWNAVRQAGAAIVAAVGWEVIIPAIIIIAVIIIAIIIFLAASSCNGGRCTPDTPTGTADDKRQTTKILALADPRQNTKLIAQESNDILKSVQVVQSRLEEQLSKESDNNKKTQIQTGLNIIKNELTPLLDQAVLSQGTAANSNVDNSEILKNLCDSIAVSSIKLIYNFGGSVIALNNTTETSLPINPVLINGFGKTLHGYSEFNNNVDSIHNIFKSYYNPAFGNSGRYIDGVDVSVPQDTPVFSPLTGIAFVYDRGTDQERIEVITENGDAFSILAHIKVSKTENRFEVKAGDIIGKINSKSQLHFQLTIGENYFARNTEQERDEFLWVKMMLSLTGQQADPTTTQRIQGSLASIFN